MKKIILLFLSIFVFGCTSNISKNTVANNQLINAKEYHLDGSDITIAFDGDRVYGFSGVNSYFGTYEQKGDNLKINGLASTLMMGDPKVMEIESGYLNDLSKVDKIKIQNGRLILTGKDIILNFQ